MKKMIVFTILLMALCGTNMTYANGVSARTDDFVFATDDEDKVLQVQTKEFQKKQRRVNEAEERIYNTKRIERMRNNEFNRIMQKLYNDYTRNPKAGMTLSELISLASRENAMKNVNASEVFQRRDINRNNVLEYVEFMANASKDLFNRDDLLGSYDKTGRFQKIEK